MIILFKCLPVNSLLADLDSVHPGHANLSTRDGAAEISWYLGADLGPASGGKALTPISLGSRFIRHCGSLRSLEELSFFDDKILIVLADIAVPITIGDGLERRVQAVYMVEELALIAHQCLVIIFIFA